MGKVAEQYCFLLHNCCHLLGVQQSRICVLRAQYRLLLRAAGRRTQRGINIYASARVARHISNASRAQTFFNSSLAEKCFPNATEVCQEWVYDKSVFQNTIVDEVRYRYHKEMLMIVFDSGDSFAIVLGFHHFRNQCT